MATIYYQRGRDGRKRLSAAPFGERSGNTASTGGCPSLDVVVKQLGHDLDIAEALGLQSSNSYKVANDWYDTQTGWLTRPYVFLPIGNECATLTAEGAGYVKALEADITAANAVAGQNVGSKTISPGFVNPSGAAGGENIIPSIMGWVPWLVVGAAAIAAIIYWPTIRGFLPSGRRKLAAYEFEPESELEGYEFEPESELEGYSRRLKGDPRNRRKSWRS